MNVNSWLEKAKKEIDGLDAELLLLEILHEKERSFLVAHGDIDLNQNDLDVLARLVDLRKRRMPLAYILGRKEFYGRNFLVDRNVLVPRPESEEIVDIVKKICMGKEFFDDEEIKILDVGTGSGCLGISFDLEIEKAKVVASDISKEALKVAAENAVELEARVEFVESDLLDKFRDEKFGVVVANLPYVDESWEWLSEDVEWEPREALFAEDGGLKKIKELIDQFVEYKSGKYLVLEQDESQVEEVVEYGEKKGLKFVEKTKFQVVFSAGD